MNLIPGKITKFDTRVLLYEEGDRLDTICFIKSGNIVKETVTNNTNFSSGNFVAHLDIYGNYYTGNYYAEAGTEIIPLPADSYTSLVQFLASAPNIHDLMAPDMCRLIVDLHDMYCTLYSDVYNFYVEVDKCHDRYIKHCENFSTVAEDFMMPHAATLYKFETQTFAKNYSIIASLVANRSKADAVHRANGSKFLKIQLSLINDIYTAYDDMIFYMRSTVSLFASKSDQCLFAIAAKLYTEINGNTEIQQLLRDMKNVITQFEGDILTHSGIVLHIDYNRIDFFFMSSQEEDDNEYANAFDDDDDMYIDSLDDILDFGYATEGSAEALAEDYSNTEDNEYNLTDFSNTLKQLCDFADMSSRYDEFNTYIEKFMALADKESREDAVRIFRKTITAAFYELYEEVFVHYAKEGAHNKLVELFLNYGFLDERLLTDNQIEALCSIPAINRTEPCNVYRMKDWLMRVYNGDEIPSKNEFDMEYVDYVRDKKKTEGLSADAERMLLTDNETKVRFEIQNMFKYNSRLISGNLLSFFPMLHMGNFEAEMENMVLTSEKINEQISSLLKIDYSIFYREMLYENLEEKIEKETIQKEIFPNIILFPVVGVNGIMWQEISGKRSNSEGRIFLPAFFNGKLEDTMLTIFGRYHWELCKTTQGTAWNNIMVPSLTSEYSDYIQFYRKNKDLSADKKEALKNQFTRCRNNMREIFVYDYIIWMKFESTGAIRLNKVARRMLATYCPFAKDIRARITNQPIFEEAMFKFERERQKKIKEISLRFKNLEKKGATMVDELLNTKRFYEEL